MSKLELVGRLLPLHEVPIITEYSTCLTLERIVTRITLWMGYQPKLICMATRHFAPCDQQREKRDLLSTCPAEFSCELETGNCDGVCTYVDFELAMGSGTRLVNFRAYNFLKITEEGMWSLQKILNEACGAISNNLITAYRSGFFLRSETEQFNINKSM